MNSFKMASCTAESHIAPPMRIVSRSRRVLGVAIAASLAACSLETGVTPGTPLDITLDFCANDTPIWFAVQDGVAPFQVLTPDASGAFSFQARGLVTVGYVRQRGSDFRTDIIFTTNVALQQMSNTVCLEEGGAKQLNGTVTGHTGSQIGLVSLSSSNAFLASGQSAWSLTQLVDRPLDLIASRLDITGFDQHSNKTIIRRAQNPAGGATFSELAFDTEGFVPTTASINVTGVSANDLAVLYSAFESSLGTSHTMTFVSDITDGLVDVEMVPTAELAAADYHKVSAIVTAPNGVLRVTDRYFKDPAAQNITIGPALIEPSVTVVGTTPHVRMRTQLLGQIDYSTMVNLAYHQQQASPARAIDVSMSVTASYFSGTPSEWNLPMPNFAGIPGWQNQWGLQPGQIDWRVTAYFGRPQLIFGAPPNLTTGETVAYASRSSSSTVSPTSLQSAGSVVRPGHFGPIGPTRVR
jgi:hypothetical protein